ncbi:MAG: glucuronate isomerase [Lachnospiraceae bacterium]|nr:glucuronate isomerase [Lachnospiraceae bacterium]
MKPFMDEDFLLSNETSARLYHNYAKSMPILDYHCHLNPREIAKDRHFENITRLWLEGDHYKWRLLRANGIDEEYITGDADDKEKFLKWAETLEKAIGNPLYHWSHLELKRYFGYDGILSSKTASYVWDFCNEILKEPDMSARSLIKNSNVSLICTTDDPIDSLKWHEELNADSNFDVTVLPTWRPDRAFQITNPAYGDYLLSLGESSHLKITSFQTLCLALKRRMGFFQEMGCRISDHSFSYIAYHPCTADDVEAIFLKILDERPITEEEILQFQTALLNFLGRQYHKLGWAMQLHYGVKRNNHEKQLKRLGPDTGFDSIGVTAPLNELADFLNVLALTNELPKTVIYSLNPNDNAAIDTIIGCFQDESAIGKIQHGSAWWFNDHYEGMREHLTSLASNGLLGNFIGMLTDSRSFVSYTRHEYFRRILCDLVGTWVEKGQYPDDHEILSKMITDICYHNALKYFRFSV